MCEWRYADSVKEGWSFVGFMRLSPCWSIFFFQAEDGIRDVAVTGVQTCALPICGDDDGVIVIVLALVVALLLLLLLLLLLMVLLL